MTHSHQTTLLIKQLLRRAVFVLLIALTACSTASPSPTATPTATSPTATVELPTAEVKTTRAPDPQLAARAWLDAWAKDDTAKMYSLLTRVSRDALTQDKFKARYSDVAVNLTLQSLEGEILQALVLSPRSAQVAFRVNFKTAMVGDLKRETTMNLTLEDGAWKVQWDDALIMPELKGGNRLAMEIKTPARGDITDRSGSAIAAKTEAVALGIVPGEIESGKERTLLIELSNLTGKPQAWIKALYDKALPNSYIPVGEATQQAIKERLNVLQNLPGLRMTDFSGRFYYDGGVAPHAVGYVQPIPAESLVEYQRKGYRLDEKVGRAGLEKWGQDLLAGTRGVSLYLTDPSGNPLSKLAQVDAKPAQSITTTLDKNLQLVAQKAIEGFRGSIVVLERDSGRVLAMVSSPGFDQNAFNPENANSQPFLKDWAANTNQPYINRASQTTYPMGSIFKTITMSAALESGIYKADTVYDCGYEFRELPGIVLYDWTKDHAVPPSGKLTLQEGLMRSCNTYFYHVGLDLYRQLGEKPVTDMARAFGLNAPTGIGQVAENGGSIPYPKNENEAVQMAFGQGGILATPLQVAAAYAAVGNGGTLYRPQIVEKISNVDGTASFTFKPEINGKLPLSAANLKAVQEALRMVVDNRRGTAWTIFTGMSIPISAKTGTATNPFGNSHAWFAGYTSAGQSDKPDLAIAVLCENAGEGSEISAPIFRRIVETYFFGRPLTLYWWESTYYVTKTPVPTATPKP